MTLASVDFKVDDAVVATVAGTALLETIFDASSLATGGHTVSAVAKDMAGNVTVSGKVNVTG